MRSATRPGGAAARARGAWLALGLTAALTALDVVEYAPVGTPGTLEADPADSLTMPPRVASRL